MHAGFGRVVTETASAVAVLAAFAAGARTLAGRAFGRAARVPGLRVRAGYRGAWLGWPLRLAGRLLIVVGRFAAGAPLGARRTDATFLDPGTSVIGGVPGWFARGQPGRWAFLPGWQRAAVRWAAVAAAAGLYARPLWAGAVMGWLALMAAAVLFPRFQRWRYIRAVVRPVYLQLCQYLGTDPGDQPGRWLTIPKGFRADPDAVVTLAYPPTWNPDAGRQRAIDQLIRRHLGADLVPAFGAFAATWRHPAAPPTVAPFEGYDLPAHRVHLATLAGGTKFIADLQDEEPHLLIAAGTGGGKTSAASVPAAHTRAHGWLVDIIDPKRRSYIDRKTGDDVLTDVSGIRVHTSIEAMMWALEEFFLSMLGVNIAVGSRTGWPGAFPQRLLIVDEFGTFAAMAARMWRRSRGTGPSPALDQRRQIEWQGRQAGHRLVVAVHQPNLRPGRQVWNRQRTDTELADPGNVTLGHKSVQRWNLPDGWVISSRPAHPALVSEDDFVAAQDINAARGPVPQDAPVLRRYLLAGLLACGVCGRRMESAWSNWPGGSGWATARASSLRISRTVSGMRPRLAGGAASGPVGGRAWVPVRSRSIAAMTAQTAKAAMTSTMCRRIAV